MSKRRKKSNKPNLPKATLERARAQAGLTDDVPEEEEETTAAEPEEVVAEPAKPEPKSRTRSSSSRRQRRVSSAQLERSKRKGELDAETVEYMLAHPTTVVEEEQLHNEYGYVIKDLRNMGILAAGLFVVLVLMAQFI